MFDLIGYKNLSIHDKVKVCNRAFELLRLSVRKQQLTPEQDAEFWRKHDLIIDELFRVKNLKKESDIADVSLDINIDLDKL